MADTARQRADKRTLERLHEKIVTRDRGWFFAQIADKVAARRAELGMSQRELAELVGTTQSAIPRVERFLELRCTSREDARQLEQPLDRGACLVRSAWRDADAQEGLSRRRQRTPRRAPRAAVSLRVDRRRHSPPLRQGTARRQSS